MASWGYYSTENTISDVLRSAKMQVISRKKCSEFFPTSLISESVICTESSHCSGDSGSLLVDENEEGEFEAVGIASFAYASCIEGVTRPSVYMRISSFLSFIELNSDLITN